MERYLSSLNNFHFIVDQSNYELKQDKRYLVPFMTYEHNEIRFGFADKNGKIIIPAIYDKVFDDFYSENDLVRVGKRFIIDYGTKDKPKQYTYFYCGVINAKGEELIPCTRYIELYFTSNDLLIVRGGKNGFQYALINYSEKEIIPFGKYHRIYQFGKGYARVLKNITNNDTTKTLFGIVDIDGNEILPLEYSNIWDVNTKYDSIVVQKDGIQQHISFKELDRIRMNIKTPDIDNDYNDMEDNWEHFGEYAGSYAQDVMGYSDDFIDDAFDGCPDAY